MSLNVMWAETDARGVECQCLFNEDARTFDVLVCTKTPCLCRAESFPASADPAIDMDAADLGRSLVIAERLVKEVAQDLGDR